MSIALGSIIIILLILPGMFFRSFVIKSESFENPLDTSFKAEVSIIFIYSIIAHYFALLFISETNFYIFNFRDFYLFFLGKGEELSEYFYDKSIFIFLTYLIGQSFLGALVGFIIRKGVIFFNWDIRVIKFPITNEWDNILSGRFNKINRISSINEKINELKKEHVKHKEEIIFFKKKRKENPKHILVTVLTDLGGKSIIYRGFLHKYYLASNNSLSKIILISTRKISDSSTIPLDNSSGNMLIIPYRNIINMDVRELFMTELNGTNSLNDNESVPFAFKISDYLSAKISIWKKYIGRK